MINKDVNNYCTLVLVRHGETEWNVLDIQQGWMDSPLTQDGISQAHELRGTLGDQKFDAIFSSDLLRAHRTAEIFNIDRQLAIQTSKALRERSAGAYEGRPKSEYNTDLRLLIEKRGELSEEEWRKFKITDDAESEEEFVQRFILSLRELSVAYAGKRVLVVTHGGSIRTVLIHLGYAPRKKIPKGSFGNCGYVTLQCDGIDFFIQEVVGLKTVDGVKI